MNVYPVESMLMSFVMHASHQGVKHVTNNGINIQKEETTTLFNVVAVIVWVLV